jgi:hypothetical protein
VNGLPTEAIAARDIVPEGAVAYAEAATTIHASAERVWSLLTDIENWPQWNPAVQQARILGAVAPGTIFKWKSGGMAITSTLRTVVPMRDLAWTGVAFGTRARHGFELAATQDGIKVATRETFDGWLPALMPKTMSRALKRNLDSLLAALKREAEQRGE